MFSFIGNSIAVKLSLFISVLVCLTALIVSSFFYIGEVRIFIEREFDSLEQQSLFIERTFSKFNKRSRLQIQKIEGLSLSSSEAQQWINVQEIPATVYIFNGKKRLVSKVRSIKGHNYDYNRANLESGQASNRINRSSIFYASLDNKLLSPVLPLIQYSYKTLTGYVVVVYELKEIFKDVRHQITTDKSLILFDSDGVILFHPNNKKFANRASGSLYNIKDEFSLISERDFLIKNKNHVIKSVIDYRGEKYITVFTKSSVVNFVLYKARDSIFVKTIDIKEQIVVMIIVLILGFAFLGWYFTRFLIRDLALITEVAEKFVKGERDLYLESNSSDEVGILSLTLQGLMRQVREREKVLKRSQRRIRETRDHLEETLSSKNGLLEDLRIEKRKVEKINKDQDELLAIVSHDLKNPLAVIETSMDIIKEEDQGSLSETVKDLIRRSKNSARTALALITDLLDLSRLDGELKIDTDKIYINELVDIIVDSYYLIKEDKKLIIEVHSDGHFDIIGDYGRINQVISNILGNAVKFLPIGGRVDINLSKDEEGNHLLIQIVDNGPGVPADKVETIFNKYEQARAGDRKIGTGLGLAICKKICELHKGTISVSSVENKGASFTISLPHVSEHIDDKISNERSIIIVDELSYNRERLAGEFSKNGWKCLKAKDGGEALFLIKKNPESVIVCDIYLPVIDGVQLCKIIQNDFPEVKVILMFDDLSNITLKFLESLNVSKAVLKPVDLDLISFEIKRIFSSSVNIQSRKIPLPTQSNINILVIDDSADMHALFNILLKSEKDCHVTSALSGPLGIELFRENRYDYVFIDMNMPEMNGDETLSLLKKIVIDHTCQFILLTADSMLDRDHLVEIGFNDYIEKPINKKKILSIVKEVK